MVTHPGATLCPDRLRRLGEPEAIDARVDRLGRPVAIRAKGRWIAVQNVQDVWRIDDEWWRAEISRLYFLVALANGRLCTVFRDLIVGDCRRGWFLQVAAPLRPAEPVVRALVAPDVDARADENPEKAAKRNDHAVA